LKEKRDVEASKHGEVSSQAIKKPTYSSSKWNDLVKKWRKTSKVDGLLKMYSRNAQKLSSMYDQALKSRKCSPQGKEYSSSSQIILKHILMDFINPTHVGQPSNHARNISKSEYTMWHVYRMSMYAIISQMYL
jgi:hypothetical protein